MPKVVVSPSDQAYALARQFFGKYPGAVEAVDFAVANTQSAFPKSNIELLTCVSRLNEVARRPVLAESEGTSAEVPADCNAPILLWVQAPKTDENQRLLRTAREGVDSTVVYIELRPSKYQSTMHRWMT